MGNSIVKFFDPPMIVAAASVAGKREEEGPLGGRFDISDLSDRFGADSWEKSEGQMQKLALSAALQKSGTDKSELGCIFAGDLINQCTASSYGLLDYDVPFFGVYGACSTLAESLILSAVTISSGAYGRVAAVCSSHHCSAERQFRSPLEYGSQRSPTSQWTVTGAGAFILSASCLGVVDLGDESYRICHCGKGIYVREALPGRSLDSGISDMTNMGAAMAPAAADTLLRYFAESGKTPADFDLIATGDLSYEGVKMLRSLAGERGLYFGTEFNDCGLMIYDREEQDMHSGGSGCGCSALVAAAEILPKIVSGEYKNVLLVCTGALMSPSSVMQGENIPGIAHLVYLSSEKQ